MHPAVISPIRMQIIKLPTSVTKAIRTILKSPIDMPYAIAVTGPIKLEGGEEEVGRRTIIVRIMKEARTIYIYINHNRHD